VKVFLAGTSLLPNYGGPAFSDSRLATALAEAGAEVGLWASDHGGDDAVVIGRVIRATIDWYGS
jgi:hypothetical protein